MVAYPDKPFPLPITFGGLDASASMVLLEGNRSPDTANVIISRQGIKKRGGLLLIPNLSQPVSSGAEVGSPMSFFTGTTTKGTSLQLIGLHLLALCGSRPRAAFKSYDTAAQDNEWHGIPAPFNPYTQEWDSVQYAYTEEYHDPSTPDNFNYFNDALYVVGDRQEPYILKSAHVADLFVDSSAAQYSTEATTFNVILTLAHTFPQSSYTYLVHYLVLPSIADNPTSEFYDLLDGKPFYLEPLAGWGVQDTQFYLTYWDGSAYSRVAADSALTTITESVAPLFTQGGSMSNSVNLFTGCLWPQGVYDSTNGVRGYPKRWDDVNGASGYTEWTFPRGEPDWPSGLEIIGESLEARAYAWGFREDPQRIDFSELGAPYNFLRSDVLQSPVGTNDAPGIDGGYFYADRGDGDPVVAVRAYQDYIVIFKQQKTMLYKGTPGSIVDPLYLVKSIPVGCVSKRSIAAIGDDLYFWSQEGPRRLSTVTEYGDIMSPSISFRIKRLLDNADREYWNKMVGRVNKKEEFVCWHMPSAGSTSNDMALVYFYNIDEWAYFTGRAAKVNSSVTLLQPDTPTEITLCSLTEAVAEVSATEECRIYIMDYGSVDGNSYSGGSQNENPISSYYYTRWYDGGDLSQTKRIMSVDLIVDTEGFNGSIKYGADFMSDLTSATAIYSQLDASAGTGIIKVEADFLAKAYRFYIEHTGTSSFSLGGIIPNIRIKGDRG